MLILHWGPKIFTLNFREITRLHQTMVVTEWLEGECWTAGVEGECWTAGVGIMLFVTGDSVLFLFFVQISKMAAFA